MLENEKNIKTNKNQIPKNISNLLALNLELKRPFRKSVKKGRIKNGNIIK